MHSKTSILVFLCWECYIPPKASRPTNFLQFLFSTDSPTNNTIHKWRKEQKKGAKWISAQSLAFSDYHVEDISSGFVYKSICSPFLLPSHHTENQQRPNLSL